MSRQPSFLARIIDRLIHSDALKTASRLQGNGRGRETGRTLAYDRHEERRLLAAASFNAELGHLTVLGSDQVDEVVVSQTGDTVTVTHSQFSTSTFSGLPIQQIIFDGKAGDDSFTNETSIPTVANGGIGNDYLRGGSGNDRLIGSRGDDLLSGGLGDDFLLAGIGDDIVHGGGGDDQISGTLGKNDLFGGDGNDIIRGGSQSDLIDGGNGDDSLFGSAGDDQISGGSGIDRIFGGLGDDLIDGNDGDDVIRGENGNDVLLGGEGNDVLVGGGGDDVLNGRSGVDTIRGDRGNDTVALNTVRDDYRVNVAGTGFRVTTLENAVSNRDTVRSVEQLRFADEMLTPRESVDVTTTPTPTPGLPTPTVPTPTPTTPDPEPTDPDLSGSETNNEALTGSGELGEGSGQILGGDSSTVLPRLINEVVTVQPIIVSNDDGSNTSAFFGNAAQQAEILRRIDEIYAVAGVDIRFLSPNYLNNTDVNVGETLFGERVNDTDEVIALGDRLGVGSSDRLVLDMYFVDRAPLGALGIVAAINGNGAIVESGEDLSTALGRDNIITTVAHELGHNLGLTHAVNDETNLMFPFSQPGVTQDQLSNDVQNNFLFIGDINRFVAGGQADVIIASPYSKPIG